MEETRSASWLTGKQVTGFGLPRGRLAKVMRRLMSRGNDPEQADVLQLLQPQAGEHIVEVGYGPGALVEALLDAGATVTGVDPSDAMCAMAGERNQAAVEAGRAKLGVGRAEETGLPDEHADAVVAVNNVVMWSDLTGALTELRRILRPGGRLVVSWHGGTEPSWMARKMMLGEEALDRIREETHAVFGAAQRHDLGHVNAFTAQR
ncbi:MAG: methyltransferase domain-containing protein [Streptosporangiales bacterium]|nr:methyltransferase domain-containing protein [Streptosporangiales bacterium]